MNSEVANSEQAAEAANTSLPAALVADGASPAKPAKNYKWYIIQAQSQCEHSVRKGILDKAKKLGLEDFVSEILVPEEEVVEVKKGVKKKTMQRLYQGYIFIHVEMNEEIWYLITNLPKVIGFVGGRNEKPTAISDKEVAKVRGRLAVQKERPKVMYETGESIRITHGPFNGFQGTIEQVNYDRNRIVASVLIFGRSTPVDLEFGHVEKAE